MILKGTSEPRVSVNSTGTWLEVSSSALHQPEALQSQQAVCGCPPSSPAPGAHTEKKGSSRPHSKVELLCLASPHLQQQPAALRGEGVISAHCMHPCRRMGAQG